MHGCPSGKAASHQAFLFEISRNERWNNASISNHEHSELSEQMRVACRMRVCQCLETPASHLCILPPDKLSGCRKDLKASSLMRKSPSLESVIKSSSSLSGQAASFSYGRFNSKLRWAQDPPTEGFTLTCSLPFSLSPDSRQMLLQYTVKVKKKKSNIPKLRSCGGDDTEVFDQGKLIAPVVGQIARTDVNQTCFHLLFPSLLLLSGPLHLIGTSVNCT